MRQFPCATTRDSIERSDRSPRQTHFFTGPNTILGRCNKRSRLNLLVADRSDIRPANKFVYPYSNKERVAFGMHGMSRKDPKSSFGFLASRRPMWRNMSESCNGPRSMSPSLPSPPFYFPHILSQFFPPSRAALRECHASRLTYAILDTELPAITSYLEGD